MKFPSPIRHRARAVAALCCVVAFCAIEADSHEPITTSVTFNKEVIRILQKHCLGCHRTGGIAGLVVLDSFEEARPWAKAIKEEVLEKRMPPYQAVKGYGDLAQGYALPQRDVELLVSWIEGGAPRGDEKDIPPELTAPDAANSWPLGPPDLVLQPEGETKIAAGEGFEERCFSLPTNLSRDVLLGAVDFRPGTRAVVHSATFLLEPQPGSATCGKTGGEHFGEWVPGQAALRLPAGTAHVLPAGARVALRVRYKRGAEVATDRSALGLYFEKRTDARPVGHLILSAKVPLPAGTENFRFRNSTTLREAVEIVGVRPLMFPLGRSVEVTAYRPDGTAEVLVLVKDYRTDWQPTYYLREPLPLPAGTRVTVTAYFDNSEKNPNLTGEARARRFEGELCELLFASPRAAAAK